jgi:inner membrane protein
MGPVLGWILWRWRDPWRDTPLDGWIKLSIIALVTHPLLDGFTPYGTQFLAPFVRDRFAWNGVAIVDPFYSVVLGAGVACAAFRLFSEETRRRVLVTCFTLSTCYLLAGLGINHWVENELRTTLENEALAEGETIERVRAYPTIFQPWLRSFVIRTDATVFVGLHSWQEAGCPAWQAFPRPQPNPTIDALMSTWQGELFEWFADGDTVTFVHREPGGLFRVRAEDVRYSWASANARGLWGLEARADESGNLVGEIERLPRPAFSRADIRRTAQRLLGRLPVADQGWHRPSNCPSDSR